MRSWSWNIFLELEPLLSGPVSKNMEPKSKEQPFPGAGVAGKYYWEPESKPEPTYYPERELEPSKDIPAPQL